jgi:uncharacterized membrane protein
MAAQEQKQRAALVFIGAVVLLVFTLLSFASGNGNWFYALLTLVTAGYGFRLLK